MSFKDKLFNLISTRYYNKAEMDSELYKEVKVELYEAELSTRAETGDTTLTPSEAILPDAKLFLYDRYNVGVGNMCFSPVKYYHDPRSENTANVYAIFLINKNIILRPDYEWYCAYKYNNDTKIYRLEERSDKYTKGVEFTDGEHYFYRDRIIGEPQVTTQQEI